MDGVSTKSEYGGGTYQWGDVLWNKPMGHFDSQHGAGASPTLFRDKVIFYNDMDKEDIKTKAPVARPATLYALSKKTGAVIWELPREAFRACYSAPFILEKTGARNDVELALYAVRSELMPA